MKKIKRIGIGWGICLMILTNKVFAMIAYEPTNSETLWIKSRTFFVPVIFIIGVVQYLRKSNHSKKRKKITMLVSFILLTLVVSFINITAQNGSVEILTSSPKIFVLPVVFLIGSIIYYIMSKDSRELKKFVIKASAILFLLVLVTTARFCDEMTYFYIIVMMFIMELFNSKNYVIDGYLVPDVVKNPLLEATKWTWWGIGILILIAFIVVAVASFRKKKTLKK